MPIDDFLTASTQRRAVPVGGVGAGQLAPAAAMMMPAGVCHAYLPGEPLTLCGLTIADVPLWTFPDGARFYQESVADSCSTCRQAAFGQGS